MSTSSTSAGRTATEADAEIDTSKGVQDHDGETHRQ